MRKRLVQPAHRHGRVLVGGQHPAFNDAHPAHPLPAGIGVGIHIVVVDVGGDIREQLVADLVRRAVENDDVHRHVVLCEEFADGVHRHPERLILGIAKNAGGDQWKCHRLTAVLLRQRKAGAIAGGELFPLAALTAVPHGADGVDDVAARQAVRTGDFASPVRQPPKVRHSWSSSGPAARWIQPSTPPPPRSVSFAALTIASTFIFVMSLRTMIRGIVSPPI